MKLKKARKNKSVLKWIFAGALLILVGAIVVIISQSLLTVKTSVRSEAAATGLDKACKDKLLAKYTKYAIHSPTAGTNVLYRSGKGCMKDSEVLFYDGGLKNVDDGTLVTGKCCADKSYMLTANDKWCSNSASSNLDMRCKVDCKKAYGNDMANTFIQKIDSGKCDKISGSTGNYMELFYGVKNNGAVCCMDPV